jgi:hypothetical protein
LAGFAVYYGIEQIYPDRRGEWISGDSVYKEVELGMHAEFRKAKFEVS